MPTREIADDDDGRRFDRVLRQAFPTVPPGAIAGAIRRGEARINGAKAQNDSRVHRGDLVEVPWQDESPAQGAGASDVYAEVHDEAIESGHWSIPIIKRTSDWIAVSKPQGLTSHGRGALDEIIRAAAAAEGWWAPSLSFRPGPVHRLDTNTSGVQLFSLSAEGARTLTEEMRRRRACKVYLGIATGRIDRRELIEDRLAWDRPQRMAIAERDSASGGKHRFATARTLVAPVGTVADGRMTLVAAVPITGRTHQIRCHLAAIGHALVGDIKYGGSTWRDIDVGPPLHPGGGEAFFLHAFALHTPALGTGVTAPLAGGWFGLIRSRFGDPAPISSRLAAIVHEACPQSGFDSTLRL